MKHLSLTAVIVGVCVAFTACAPQNRIIHVIDYSSVFHVTTPAAELVAQGQPILVRMWSVECSDPKALEVRELCGELPMGPGMPFDAEVVAARLDALAARGELHLLSTPSIVVAADGGRAEIRMTEQVDRPDLQRDVVRGESLFPFELGERFIIVTSFEEPGFIGLALDYRLERLASGSLDDPLPSVLATRIDTSVSLKSGQSVVLGGLWVPASDGNGEAVLLVILNARALAPARSQDEPEQFAATH